MKSFFVWRPLESLPRVGRGRGGGSERSELSKNRNGINRALWVKIVQPTAASRAEKFLSGRFALTPTPNPSPQGGGGLPLAISIDVYFNDAI